jgi:DNA repair exonuclease SbcCD ATPase subunit
MNPGMQLVLTIGVPTLAVLMGILVNNSRLGDMNSRFGDLNNRLGDLNNRFNDLRAEINTRFNAVDQRLDDMKDMWRSELHRVEEVLDARLKHLEER